MPKETAGLLICAGGDLRPAMSFPLEGGGSTYQGHVQMNPAEGVMTTMIPATQLTGFQTDYTPQSQPAQQQGTAMLLILHHCISVSLFIHPCVSLNPPISALNCHSSFLLNAQAPQCGEKAKGGTVGRKL